MESLDRDISNLHFEDSGNGQNDSGYISVWAASNHMLTRSSTTEGWEQSLAVVGGVDEAEDPPLMRKRRIYHKRAAQKIYHANFAKHREQPGERFRLLLNEVRVGIPRDEATKASRSNISISHEKSAPDIVGPNGVFSQDDVGSYSLQRPDVYKRYLTLSSKQPTRDEFARVQETYYGSRSSRPRSDQVVVTHRSHRGKFVSQEIMKPNEVLFDSMSTRKMRRHYSFDCFAKSFDEGVIERREFSQAGVSGEMSQRDLSFFSTSSGGDIEDERNLSSRFAAQHLEGDDPSWKLRYRPRGTKKYPPRSSLGAERHAASNVTSMLPKYDSTQGTLSREVQEFVTLEKKPFEKRPVRYSDTRTGPVRIRASRATSVHGPNAESSLIGPDRLPLTSGGTAMDGSDLCERCQSLDFLQPAKLPEPGVRAHKLGSFEDVQRSSCVLCKFVAQLLPQARYSSDESSREQVTAVWSKTLVRLSHALITAPGVVWRLDVTHMVELEGLSDGQNRASPIAMLPQLLDVNKVKSWLRKCESRDTHKSCRLPLTASGEIDLVLVDVVDNCLTRATSKERYVCLSYVSGDQRGFETTLSTFTALLQPGSLRRTSGISAAVIDAIGFVRSMEERFLWADTLCIIQDSAELKHADIARMDIIYGQSLLTLVNPCGFDASAGLPGVIGRPRQSTKLQCDFQCELPVFDQPTQCQNRQMMMIGLKAEPFTHLWRLLHVCPFEERGWTFQERTLSRRLLFFTPWAAYFVCEQAVRSDTVEFEDTRSASLALYHPLRRVRRATMAVGKAYLLENLLEVFSRYVDLAANYTSRKLTFDSDALNAFQGVVNVLQSQLQCEFKFGMPMGEYLHLSLLWFHEDLAQRLDSFVYTSDGVRQKLPSWCWAAWKGPVWHNCLFWDYEQNAVLPTSIVSEIERVGDAHQTDLALGHMLIFRASSVPDCEFTLHRATHVSTRKRLEDISIHDCKGDQCGLIFHTSMELIQDLRMDDKLEIILISRWQLHGRRPSLRDGWDEPYPSHCWDAQYVGKEDDDPWIMNIMLVVTKGEQSERLGVGVLQEGAWRMMRRVRKIVNLI